MTGFFIIVKVWKKKNRIKYEERKINSSSSCLKVTITQPAPINWLTRPEGKSEHAH